jgi:hypothetical protein
MPTRPPDAASEALLDTLLPAAQALSRQLFRIPDGSGSAPPWTDGRIRIPRAGAPEREAYERRFVSEVLAWFAPHATAVRALAVPTDEARVIHANGIRNHARYELYVAMLEAGEPVPPIFVERRGGLFHIRDGNHRTYAARRVGVRELVALTVEPG